MRRETLLDLDALHKAADGSPKIRRHLLLLYIETAGQCLGRLQGMVVHGSHADWKTILHDLGAASRGIHATQLATLSRHAVDMGNDAVSRMGAYLQLKEAYDALLAHLKNANLLTPDSPVAVKVVGTPNDT